MPFEVIQHAVQIGRLVAAAKPMQRGLPPALQSRRIAPDGLIQDRVIGFGGVATGHFPQDGHCRRGRFGYFRLFLGFGRARGGVSRCTLFFSFLLFSPLFFITIRYIFVMRLWGLRFGLVIFSFASVLAEVTGSFCAGECVLSVWEMGQEQNPVSFVYHPGGLETLDGRSQFI